MKSSGYPQRYNNKTVLITGGCGFIGVNVARYLISHGFAIKILDNLSTGNKENLLSAGCHLSDDAVIIGDIRNQDTVKKVVKGADAVVHLAAHTRVLESLTKPQETWDINTRGTSNLLEACRRAGVNTFIFASSNVSVGEQFPPIDETKVPKPISPYGASKLAGEALCTSYYYSFGLNTVSLRFANSYGPHSKHKSSVIAKFIKSVMQNEPLIIYGDGKQTRDFIHVDDICQAIYICLTTTNPIFGEIFQIASGRETTINELVSMIIAIAGNNIQVTYEPKRKGEIERNYSNIAKARRMLGYEPKIDLKDGLHDLWQWYTGVGK